MPCDCTKFALDVLLDLQAALTACFDLVGYERLLDYTKPLSDLSAEDTAWIGEIVSAAELIRNV